MDEDDDDDEDLDDDILPNDEDGATEDDLNDVASDLESDITHNSLSYNEDNYNNQQLHQQQKQKHCLQHHLKKQQKQQQQQLKHQHCHSSDIDENQTINVSSQHHQQQQQQQQKQHHLKNLQSSSRDCIQNKVSFRFRNIYSFFLYEFYVTSMISSSLFFYKCIFKFFYLVFLTIIYVCQINKHRKHLSRQITIAFETQDFEVSLYFSFFFFVWFDIILHF